MKSISALGIVTLLALPVHSAGAELVIAKHGHSDYRIVVPDVKSSAVAYAAGELQRFLGCRFLAYDYTIIPPRITKPRANVIIRLCHYGCYFHGVEKEDMSKDFRAAVDGWPDRFDLSNDQGRELLARFKNVVQAFSITNESEGPIGNMSRFLADMDARYGKWLAGGDPNISGTFDNRHKAER